MWSFQHLLTEAGRHHLQPFSSFSLAGSFSGRREILRVDISRPALVLGSSQSDQLIDVERLKAGDTELVRRQSGGGLVHLVPGEFLWVDVILPADNPLYRSDVAEGAVWLGEVWQKTLADFKLDTYIYEGEYQRGPMEGLVCFGSRASGELMMTPSLTSNSIKEGSKVVGISQRRTRTAVWFQSLLLLEWNPKALLSCLSDSVFDKDVKSFLGKELENAGWAVNISPEDIISSFRKHIPSD